MLFLGKGASCDFQRETGCYALSLLNLNLERKMQTQSPVTTLLKEIFIK